MKTVKKVKKVKAQKKEVFEITGRKDSVIPTTLDQILGEDNSPYSTNNVQEYIEMLGDFGKTDIANHAHLVGLIPIDNREELVRRLVKKFRGYQSSLMAPNPDSKIQDNNASSEILSIMSEGR
jgi:hypothetical protein